ncbi:MAG TPA: KGG domain-containing protein [Acetobacteraceae bacterium]|nr:KGG domain-containing protein [Acetobacteraceae bacterium]
MANQGKGSAGNFANDPKRAAEAGRKGGMASRGGGGKENNPANFANDRQKASDAGRKGGLASHRKRSGGESSAG